MTVVLLASSIVVFAIISGHASRLVLLVMLIPVVGAYAAWDHWLRNLWRRQLLARWQERAIDLVAYRAAIVVVPSLPHSTLHSMLETLPPAVDLSGEQAISAADRQNLASVLRASDTWGLSLLLTQVLLLTAAVIELSLAVIISRRHAVGAICLVAVIPLILRLARAAQRRQQKVLQMTGADANLSQLSSRLPAAFQARVRKKTT